MPLTKIQVGSAKVQLNHAYKQIGDGQYANAIACIEEIKKLSEKNNVSLVDCFIIVGKASAILKTAKKKNILDYFDILHTKLIEEKWLAECPSVFIEKLLNCYIKKLMNSELRLKKLN